MSSAVAIATIAASPGAKPEATSNDRTASLADKALRVFRRSGPLFFKSYKNMHGALLNTDVPALIAIDETCTKTHVSDEELLLVLRLWAGELQRPKKRKAQKTLYERATDLTTNQLVLAACRAVCLELAWDRVQTECGNRLTRAEESEYWDDASNAERATTWGARHDAMMQVQGLQLAAAAQIVLDRGDLAEFQQALADGFEELDCA